jgi:hypothetical protein
VSCYTLVRPRDLLVTKVEDDRGEINLETEEESETQEVEERSITHMAVRSWCPAYVVGLLAMPKIAHTLEATELKN